MGDRWEQEVETPPGRSLVLHSYLYAPGDRPDLMAKAVAGEAHAVILDLEDGVAPGAADAARLATRNFLSGLTERTVALAVRVHPGRLAHDLELAVTGGVDLVYLPKADVASVTASSAMLDDLGHSSSRIVALIETAQGLLDAPRVAAMHRVVALALGEADLFAELGLDPGLTDGDRAAIRLQLVIASAAAGLRGPTAPASTDFRDLDRFRQSCTTLRRTGFVARSAVHPAQVPIINEVFAPSNDELDQARRIVADFDAALADGRGITVGEDGTMLDEAVVRSARRLLD